MSPTDFAHPEWAPALAVTGAAATLAVALARRRARARGARLLPANRLATRGGLAGDAMLLAALLLIGVALVGPRVGERTVEIASDGVDVVFLLDASRSMDAEDVPPSRLDRARRAVEQLLARLEPADRAALAAFAGGGALLTPLTPDHGALAELLPGVNTDLFRPASSRLDAGVSAAVAAFEPGSRRPRVIVVLSDGEDPDRRRRLGTGVALARDVRVVTAAIGSDAGGPVPADGVPLRRADGRPVVSRRDADRLAALAEATGGVAFAADRWGRFDFDAAAASLRRDVSPQPGRAVARRVRAVQVAPLAALAFVLLLVEGVAGRRGAARAGQVAPVALALLLAGSFVAARADAGRGPAGMRDAREWIASGLAALEAGRHAEAGRAFLAAAVHAREPAVAAVAHYDRGVAALAAGDAATARDAFFEALALDPSDREARFNLEWSLALLQTAAAPPSPPPAPKQDPASPDASDGGRPPAPPERAPREAAAPGTQPPELDPVELERWLERVDDDPRRGLRAAAGRHAGPPGGPAW